MRIAYDAEVDALSIVFREGTVTTKELGEGIALEYAVDGRLAGVESLDAVERFGDAGTLRQITLGSGLSRRRDRPERTIDKRGFRLYDGFGPHYEVEGELSAPYGDGRGCGPSGNWTRERLLHE